jgi:hypothetical protein
VELTDAASCASVAVLTSIPNGSPEVWNTQLRPGGFWLDWYDACRSVTPKTDSIIAETPTPGRHGSIDPAGRVTAGDVAAVAATFAANGAMS